MPLDNGDVQKIAQAMQPIIHDMIESALDANHAKNVQPHLEGFYARMADLEIARDDFEGRAMATVTALKLDEFFAAAWERFIHSESDRLFKLREEEAERAFRQGDAEDTEEPSTATGAEPIVKKVRVEGADSSD